MNGSSKNFTSFDIPEFFPNNVFKSQFLFARLRKSWAHWTYLVLLSCKVSNLPLTTPFYYQSVFRKTNLCFSHEGSDKDKDQIWQSHRNQAYWCRLKNSDLQQVMKMSDHIEKPWQEIKPNTNSPQVNFWKCVINKQENFNIDQPSRDTSIQSFMNLSLPEIRTFILIQKQYIYKEYFWCWAFHVICQNFFCWPG